MVNVAICYRCLRFPIHICTVSTHSHRQSGAAAVHVRFNGMQAWAISDPSCIAHEAGQGDTEVVHVSCMAARRVRRTRGLVPCSWMERRSASSPAPEGLESQHRRRLRKPSPARRACTRTMPATRSSRSCPLCPYPLAAAPPSTAGSNVSHGERLLAHPRCWIV